MGPAEGPSQRSPSTGTGLAGAEAPQVSCFTVALDPHRRILIEFGDPGRRPAGSGPRLRIVTASDVSLYAEGADVGPQSAFDGVVRES